jgi:hypothetical protein
MYGTMVHAQKGQPRGENGKSEWIALEKARLRSVDLHRKPGEMISVNRHFLKYGRSAQSNLK